MGRLQEGADRFVGCCVSGFPNLFTILGPNTITGHTSTVYTAECSINYSLRMARAVLSSHAKSIEVLPRAQRKYMTWLQRELEKCIWTKENGGNHPKSLVLLFSCHPALLLINLSRYLRLFGLLV
jgi:hypothetical protein